MKTITQEQWEKASQRDREIRFRGATGPGQYTWNETESRFEPALPSHQQIAHDFDTGFGIGGINRYQPTATEEMELIEAQIQHMEREEKRVRKGPMPHGQLWEPCPICGQEPVCLDCGLCYNHCDC